MKHDRHDMTCFAVFMLHCDTQEGRLGIMKYIETVQIGSCPDGFGSVGVV